MTAALEGGEWSTPRPGHTLPPGKTRYPFCRWLRGPQDRSVRVENLIPTGIRSRTVQPVAQSLYRLSCPAHTYPVYLRILREIRAVPISRPVRSGTSRNSVHIWHTTHGVQHTGNLTGHSMSAPVPCRRPAVFFFPLRLITL
jgi:hypothetical protein